MSQNPFDSPRSFDTSVRSYSSYDNEPILADPWTRFGARFIDNMLAAGSVIPGYGLILCAGPMAEDGSEETAILGGLLALVGLALLVVGSLGFAIYQWYLISTTGQSLGKKWLNIRIVGVGGRPVNFVNGVILREWVLPFLGAFVPFLGLIDALLIFGQKRQCLHDLIASTQVVSAYDLGDDSY